MSLQLHSFTGKLFKEAKVNEDIKLNHYTSPEGIIGILDKENIKLHFTCVECLNDYLEQKEAIRIYNKVCEQLHNKKEIDDEFYNVIRELKILSNRYFFGIGNRPMVGECQKYVCCFSEESDSLPMWNYYVKNKNYQGYNIGFMFDKDILSSLDNVLTFSNKTNYRPEIRIYRMIYDDEKKTNIMEEIVREANKLWVELEDCRNQIEHYLTTLVCECALYFKSQYFSHEREVRIEVNIPKNEDDWSQLVKFKNTNGYIASYLESKIDKKYAKCIKIGPVLEKTLAESMIRNLLTYNKYKINDVSCSNAPIRF